VVGVHAMAAGGVQVRVVADSEYAASRRVAAQPIGTASVAESVTRFVPYVSRSHVLIAPTITPTPPPTRTPYPPPEGFGVRCDKSGALEICSWLPSGEPEAGAYVEGAVRLVERGHPVAGARMTIRWVFPYPTLFKYCDAETGADGVATCGADAPHVSGQTGAAQIGLPYGGWPYQRQIGFRIR
jgi:hypothetical protein